MRIINIDAVKGMSLQEAVRRAGSKNALAKLLGINRQAITVWGDKIPKSKIYDLIFLRPEWFR